VKRHRFDLLFLLSPESKRGAKTHLFLLCDELRQEGGEAKHFINNHLRFTILYHKDIETDLARIVGFEIQPTRCASRESE
jgi:hypothetical protein